MCNKSSTQKNTNKGHYAHIESEGYNSVHGGCAGREGAGFTKSKICVLNT